MGFSYLICDFSLRKFFDNLIKSWITYYVKILKLFMNFDLHPKFFFFFLNNIHIISMGSIAFFFFLKKFLFMFFFFLIFYRKLDIKIVMGKKLMFSFHFLPFLFPSFRVCMNITLDVYIVR